MAKDVLINLLSKEELKDYSFFKKKLTINSRKIVFDIFICWSMIFFSFYIFFLIKDDLIFNLILFPFLSFFISFWKRSYLLLFHESAHYNLNKNKYINDLLSFFLFTPFTAQFVKNYRRHHWEHHVHLGTQKDTEISYQKPLNKKNIFYSLTGIYLIKTLLRYFKVSKVNSQQKKIDKINLQGTFLFFIGLLVFFFSQLIILLILYHLISLFAAITWFITTFITDIFFANLRQTLEHRDPKFGNNDDFCIINHGEKNKLFNNNFLSYYFGGAGFNKHLIHHLDPTISYTRFIEVENYLMKTSLRNYLYTNKTTYLKELKKLIVYG